MQSWPMRNYQFTLPIRYHLTEPKGHGVVVCLHGYQDNAMSMLRRMGWWGSELPFQILAFNAPFPVPVRTDTGFLEAYSWYFRDTDAKIMLVDPVHTSLTLRRLVIELGLENTPKVLFGFSQGGYLAPYLAAELKHVHGILGLGCGYNLEAYRACPPLTVHAIHGDHDEIVSFSQSRKSFAEIAQFGHTGDFHEIPHLTHRVENSLDPLVRQLIHQCFLKPIAGESK